MWQELLEILVRLGKDYEALNSLGQQKHKALVMVDMKALEKLLKREEDLAKSVSRSEEARRELLARMAKAMPGMSAETSAQELYRLAPPHFTVRLERAHALLSGLVDQARKQAEINNILAQGALGAVNVRLGQLGGTAVDPVYGRNGGERVTHRRNFEYDA